MISAGGEKVGP